MSADFLEHYANIAACWITGEDLPQATNRITFHANERDAYGLPVPVVEYSDQPNSAAMRKHAEQRCNALYESLGARRTKNVANIGSCRTEACSPRAPRPTRH